MVHNQNHHGYRLKKIIEKSNYKVKDISKNSGIALSSLYDMYQKEELLQSKVLPVLVTLGIDIDTFYNKKEDVAPDLLSNLKREIELLKQQVADKDEIISLLKSKG